MTRSRASSATTIVIGCVAAFAAQLALFPAVGLQAGPWQQAMTGFARTALFVAQSHVLHLVARPG